MAQRIGASGRQTVLAVFAGGFSLDCYEINISDDLEKGLRSSEKQKPRACVPHTLYVGIGGFMRATACWAISWPLSLLLRQVRVSV